MIEVVKKNRFGITSEKEIADFEAKIGYELPLTYKTFLLEANGGEPVLGCIHVLQKGKSEEWNLANLLGLHDKENGVSLNSAFDQTRGRMPEEFIPFADDQGGNYYVLNLSKKKYGEIHFWDHNLEAEKGRKYYKNISFLFSSFQAFSESLGEPKPYEKEVKIIKKDGKLILD